MTSAECASTGIYIYEYTVPAGCTFTGDIDWGDGSSESVTATSSGSIAHSYLAAGIYQVRDVGTGSAGCDDFDITFTVEVP